MASTRIRQQIKAPRASVYRALLDPTVVAAWRVPDGMTCQVHVFELRVDGEIRVSRRNTKVATLPSDALMW
jgi:uncharacterized protein YndB with AHSA1/START domain